MNRNLLYARYLLSVHLGKEPLGEVDHIDGDRTNDLIQNLQPLPSRENASKGGVLSKRVRRVSLLCLHCGRWFERDFRQTFLADFRKCQATYCSKSCSYFSHRYKGIPQEYHKLFEEEFTLTPSLKRVFEPWEEWRGAPVEKECLVSPPKKEKRKLPSLEELQDKVSSLGYRGTGNLYGVSDNAIRKWIHKQEALFAQRKDTT